MRKAMVGARAGVALVVAALALGPTLWAQGRGRQAGPGVDRDRPLLQDRLLLQGPGSEIGASVRELRSDEISAARPNGVFVQEVRSGSPAERAGLRTGDVVIEFDGERVRGTRQFTRLVRETPPGRPVKTTIVRDGAQQTLDITPEAGRQLSLVIPDIGREIERAFPRDFEFALPQLTSRARLGVTLTPLGDQLASYFGVERGALVSAVAADSAAAQAGLRAGDIITTVNGRTVDDPPDVAAAVRDAAAGATLEIRIVRDKMEMTLKATVPGRDAPQERIRV
ncbi:MAG: PDZ domain-containing protein [Acidobacteria bacterium]|nr:PDZ domain-containing protein [Acidobacteriota bacterium]